MKSIGRRIEKLEQKSGVRKEITLETLLGVSNGCKDCERLLDEAIARSEPTPILEDIIATAESGKALGSEHGD